MPGGRPTVWTEEATDKLADALIKGLSRARAAACAGIGRTTFFDRLKEDAEFSDWVYAREAEGMLHHATKLHEIETADPKTAHAVVAAAKIHLTTRGEDAWTEKKSIEHEGRLSVAEEVARAEALSDEIDEAMSEEGDG